MAGIHNIDPVCACCLFHKMRDPDDRNIVLAIPFVRRFQNLSAACRIEHRCRFVKDDAFRMHCKDACDRDPLLLAA